MTTTHSTYRFSLNIPAADYLAYYQGTARTISVIAHTGQRIEFAAKHLQPYLLHDGIHGVFELSVDSNNSFAAIRKL